MNTDTLCERGEDVGAAVGVILGAIGIEAGDPLLAAVGTGIVAGAILVDKAADRYLE